MTADRNAAPKDRAAQAPCGKAPLPDFARLAKRLSVWTSRGIISAAILVAGLAFGRQVLDWWGVDRGHGAQVPQQPPAVGALGDPAQEHVLEFGDSPWRMSRRTEIAREDTVSKIVETRCADLIASCQPPAGDPGPAERELLERIAGTKPAREEKGQWQLFALNNPTAMVVGTRWTETNSPPQDGKVAKPRQRVVTLGMAVPAGDQAWTVYAFHAAPQGGMGSSAFPELPIPPGGRRTLAVRAADGTFVATLKGVKNVSQWGRFFDTWFASHGWRVADAWQRRGAVYSVRAVHESGDSLDVLLTPQGDGEMIGLVVLTPGPHKGKQP